MSARPLFLVTVALLVACGAGAPAQSLSPIQVVAAPVAEFLRINGASFDPAGAPATGIVSGAQATEIARTRLSVRTVATSNATYGRLRDPRLGTRSDRFAWLVVFTVQSGSAWAFVDALDSEILETFAPGP